MLLPAPDEDRVRVVEARAVAVQREPAGPCCEVDDIRRCCGGPRPTRRRAARPVRSPTSTRVPGRGFSWTGSIVGQPSSCHCTGVTNVSRPRAEKARVMLRGRTPSRTQNHSPSGPMTRSPWPVFCTGRIVRAGRDERILRRRLERTLGTVAAGDADAVAALGAALGDHQVPGAVHLVQMRCLGELPARARPQRPRLLERDVIVEVDLHLQDAEVRADAGAAQDESRVRDVGGAVVVPRDVGIDAVDAARAVRAEDDVALAPRARRHPSR